MKSVIDVSKILQNNIDHFGIKTNWMSKYSMSQDSGGKSNTNTNITPLNGGVVIELDINEAYEINYY